MILIRASLIAGLLFSHSLLSSGLERKSVTYDEDRKEFIIVVDRKFFVLIDTDSLASSKDKTVNVGNYPQKFNEVFNVEKN